MNRRIATAALTFATLTSTFGLSSRAFADDAQPLPVAEPVVLTQTSPEANAEALIVKTTVDPTTRLIDLKTKGAAAIAKRQATLAELSGKIAVQAKDCGSNAAMTTEITNTSTGLTGVGTTLAAATDVKAARDLYRSIFIDFRVYMVVAPKAGKVIRCDTQLLRNDALTAEGAKLQLSIDEAKAKGVDTTAAQSAKDAAMTQLSGINPAAALPLVMGLVPDKGDKAVAASNTAALRSSDAVLDGTYGAQKSVNAQFGVARKALNAANAAARSAAQAARTTRVKTK
jgi:hypothetical protein